MGYTQRKIRRIDRSFFIAAVIFSGWAVFCAWTGWPRSFRHSAAVGFVLFAVSAIFFLVFPILWARFPEKHPVNHELRRYGKLREVSEKLDAEMAGRVEILGPFRFTASFLVYDSAYEFQMVPYDHIASVNRTSDEGTAAVIVQTRGGRRYQWYSTWMQGFFDAEKIEARLRAAAHLDDLPVEPPSAGP